MRPLALPAVVLGLLVLSLPAHAGEVSVHASLEPQVIGLGETATLSIELRGEGVSSLRFRPNLRLENLEIVGGPSQYEDLRYTNGQWTRSYRLSWQVRGVGVGRAAVRDISVVVGDRQVPLQAQEIRVQREPTQPAQPPRGQDDEDPFQRFFGRMPVPGWRRPPDEPGVFLRAEVQPQQPVVGQQVLYTVYLFTREDIAAISPSGVPAFRGFWVQDVPIPQQPPMEMVEIDGRRYGRVPLIQKALFPLRSGRYTVEPASIDLTVERYDRSFFFGPAVSRPQTLRLKTEGQTLDVQPLPPAPPGFAGAVGQVALTARLEPRELRLGEAATLTVELAGHGNLQGLPEPRLAPPPGLTVYPPQQEGKEEVSGTLVRGRRSWSYVVVPDRSGRFRIEAPRVTFFDPVARQYRMAAAPDLELNALPRPETAAAGRRAVPRSLRPAALTSGSLARWKWSPLLPWLFALPLGLALIVTLARRRSSSRKTRKTASPAPAARLEAALAAAGAEERPRQVAARLEEAWRDFLAERWDVPVSTPSSRWSERLAARGVEAGALGELGQLLDDLEYLRYAPQLSTTDTLRSEVVARCRRLLRRLQ